MQYRTHKSKQRIIKQNKTTLVQSPLTTLGQETRWPCLYFCNVSFTFTVSVAYYACTSVE